METEILTHLNDPKQLERLYRMNKASFKQAFNALYPALEDKHIADYWNERLNYEVEAVHLGTRKELLFIIAASVIAGLVAQLPSFFSIDDEFFYTRNIGFIVFPLLTVYFAWQNKLAVVRIAFLLGAMLIAAVFINLIPNIPESDTVVLSCLHLVLVLWSISGIAFVGKLRNNSAQRTGFLIYSGDLLVMIALIAIAGAILSGITVGLFSAIGVDIKAHYFQYIGITGVAATPLVATYLIRENPQLVGRVSPVIARIFCPLVLVMLVTYLTAMVYGGRDPYTDRDFLVIFNVLLIGVIAIIFFSIAGATYNVKNHMGIWILTLLAAVTVVVNGIALSAILFRITEWGITPNRAAVLGANLLMLVNLLLVTVQLFKILLGKSTLARTREMISFYLPIYGVWAVIVTFLFPLIFGF